jgi:hypothetical protein
MELNEEMRLQGLVVLSMLNTFKQAGVRHGGSQSERIIQDIVFPQLHSLAWLCPHPYAGPPATAYTSREDRIFVVSLVHCHKLLLALAAAEQRPMHPDNMYMSVYIPFVEDYAAALREVAIRDTTKS